MSASSITVRHLDNENYKQLAAQLRKPTGEMGQEVARFMNAGNELLNRNTINQIDAKPNLRVVEVGMANGKFIPELFETYSVKAYYGCDFSEDMVHEAAKLQKDRSTHNPVQFYHASAENLPFESRSIDVVFTVNTIYFWENVKQVLKEFRRILTDKGQILIGLRPEHLMKHYPFVQYGFNLFSAEDVSQFLEGNGFNCINTLTFQEPDFENDGITFPVQSLVVKALK